MKTNVEKDNSSLKEAIKKISDMYFIAIHHKSDKTLKDSGSSKDEYKKFILRVRRAFARLDYFEKEVINNDFFYQAYSNWWKDRYTKSFYYRLRNRSMLHFMEEFNHEN